MDYDVQTNGTALQGSEINMDKSDARYCLTYHENLAME